ncbi:MAG TPA: hypothetical protein VGP82_03460 [Ktedonobacterales bacterium]|jgi:hypothetical protein|nr:hypothetical protein [Ktedonobacterales bacterium]
MEDAARAYAGLARALRAQGLYEPAWRYRMRQLTWEQRMRVRQRQFTEWFGGAMASLVVGSQERLMRPLMMWVLVVLVFALAYYGLGQHARQDYLEQLNVVLSSTGPSPSIDAEEALALSLRAATGQVSLPTELGVPTGDVVAFQVLSVIEAWCSLLIVGLFVTMWWRRTMRE